MHTHITCTCSLNNSPMRERDTALCAQEVIMRNFRSQLCHWNVCWQTSFSVAEAHAVDKRSAKNRREIAVSFSIWKCHGWAHAGEKGDPRRSMLYAHVWFDRPNIFTPPISYTFKKVHADDGAWERERFSHQMPVENSALVLMQLLCVLWCGEELYAATSSYSFSIATWPRLFLHNEVINSCPIVNLEKLLVRREQKVVHAYTKRCVEFRVFVWSASAHAPKFMNKTRIENTFWAAKQSVDS
jgi:hypothetical protein